MKYGVTTSKIVKREDLDISEISKEHSEEYKPTRIRHFRLLIKGLKLPEESVFVDMGSGKGRVLLMASMYNFKRITGVEISSKLCEIARNNIAIYEKKLKRPLHIEVVNEDVLKYNIKNDENVFYFYKPFDNFVMEKIIERVIKSLNDKPRKGWLIINNFIPFSAMIENKYKFPAIKKFIYGGTEFAVYAID
jgi:16S rRNA G966 N2-methylase RsmD